ncbi:MAG: YciI family protein [Alphaproteobacteria bacterium]
MSNQEEQVLYFIHRVDKPGVHELRMATRPAHMEFAEGLGDTLYFAGPTMNDDGEMNGSVWIIEASDRAEAEAITANDPYEKVDLFETKVIRRFVRTAGTA